MENVNDVLKSAATKLGNQVKFDGLMSQKAHIKNNIGTSDKDILGWDYVVHWNDRCYMYYAAQPPLSGMTQPQPIPCPLGIRIFNEYKIDLKQAIDIFHSSNAGDKFIKLALYYPLTPEVTEPLWSFLTSIGNTIIIGANTGKVHQMADLYC